ncbi:hypothetical protein ITJ57_02375 [Plantibacter sp. VKM Ac-2880]|uniref:hypothetical protein n=1 Tax=Plantibacter sp. VKM Ac-2880 TaxID=2783827 RepID=UPI00188F782F|nr:hypothetical protein [Plantibacter sp. VKM Ac-2880]MBF4567600.1 hypothetical protein [Plantibacter sp. VKM Ac-2880]
MRVFGVIAIVLAALGLVVGVLLLFGNPDLASPGPQLLPAVAYDSWRFLLGVLLWFASLLFVAGVLAVSRQPGLAWLMLLAFIPLLVVYLLGGGLMPSLALAIVAVVVLGLVVPAIIAAVGLAIGGAVRRRKLRTATV